jgi:preprotein translocase subunit SecF
MEPPKDRSKPVAAVAIVLALVGIAIIVFVVFGWLSDIGY